jgi:hemerythrin-like domain-containing protein
MNALATLEREHLLLSGTLDALERWNETLLRTDTADRDDLARFVRVIGELADLAHHEKEEDILLPLLTRCGFDWETGPIKHVRTEHQHERYLCRVIAQAASQEDEWSEEDRRHLIASIDAYVAFQRRHMKQEDIVLYPAVDRLSPEQQVELAAKLRAFDENFGILRYEELVREAEALTRKYMLAT